jgi:cytochrome P450
MCLGASLGRLELEVAIEELLAAAPGFVLTGEPRPTRFPEIGALSAPIAFTEAA